MAVLNATGWKRTCYAPTFVPIEENVLSPSLFEVKETEPKIVLEWEAHPHSAVTHLEEVVGVNGDTIADFTIGEW